MLTNDAKMTQVEIKKIFFSKNLISGSKTENSTYRSPKLPESKFLSMIYFFD